MPNLLTISYKINKFLTFLVLIWINIWQSPPRMKFRQTIRSEVPGQTLPRLPPQLRLYQDYLV